MTGPSQSTSAEEALRVRAAVEPAVAALDRTRASIQRHLDGGAALPPPSLAPAIDQAKDAFRAAVDALGADQGHADERRRLFDALGSILAPLEALVAQVSRPDAPKRARATRESLVQAYREILAPTEPHFWPAAEASKPAGAFVPTNEAVTIARVAFDRFSETRDALAKSGAPLSQEAEIALFEAILSSEKLGVLMSIDAGVLDFLPEHLAKSVTRDHHGIHGDPARPEVNSTMRMLDDVASVRAMDGLSEAEKIAKLQNRYAYLTTNNLGDAIIPLVLARRIPELVRDGGITVAMKAGTEARLTTGMLRRLSHFEDFGFFGSSKLGEGKRRSAPGEVLLRDLIHVVLANFRSFDELLREYGLAASDRFDSLPDELQASLVEKAIAKVEENFDDYGARLGRANGFKAEVEKIKGEVQASHDSMRSYLVEHGVSERDLKTLDDSVFYFFDTMKGGRFATWDAPALVHKNAIQWQSIRFPGEPPGWGFVLAVPSGRDPHFLDTSIAKAFGPHLPTAVVRGETLLFVFDPKVSAQAPEKMAVMLAEQLRAHHSPNPAPEAPNPPPSVGENVVSHDAYLYDDEGRYVWTAERLRDAEQTAREAFIAALDQPWCKRAVLLIGTPGAGKTSHLKNHLRNDTIYYDSTLATPERRKPLIDAARARGIPVEIVWADTPLDECLARNAGRSEDRRVPEEILRAAHQQLEQRPPSAAEGADHVTLTSKPLRTRSDR